MSRYSDVLLETDKVFNRDNVDCGSRIDNIRLLF